MATYATAEQLVAYCAVSGVVIAESDDEREALILRAEEDVDRILGPYLRDPVTGRKLIPNLLTAAQRDALARATCAAAEFRAAQGEDTLVGDDDGTTSVPELGLAAVATLPRPPGPKCLEALADYGLVIRSGCAAPAA